MLPDNLTPVGALSERPISGDDLARIYGRPHTDPVWDLFA